MQKKMFTVDQNKTILVAIILMDLNENNIMLKVKHVMLLWFKTYRKLYKQELVYANNIIGC